VAKGAKEPSLGDLTAFAQAQFGLDPDSDRVPMMGLAAIGLTVQAWRNTSLEDLHAGDHVNGGLPDSDMMRFNIATFRVVKEHVAPDRCEWDALQAALTDPDRILPGGSTVGALAGGEFEQLASDVRNALSISRLIERQRGFPFLRTLLAVQAGTSNKEWYGSPWWQDVVKVFIELLDDPASSAWKYDERYEPVPPAACDRTVLAEALLEKPESLDDQAIFWCLKHGLSRSATFAGFARWRARRDPPWVDPAPWLSEG
jgi:hypothetical protein